MVKLDIKTKYASISKLCNDSAEAMQYIKELKDMGQDVITYRITRV